MAWARTVAVVVPSPAVSEVFEATSRTICAPAFSSSSFSSISLATVTPSLVIVGGPNFFSSTTLRPRGPSVTFTASASLLTPRSRSRRADCSNSRIFGIGSLLLLALALRDGEDVAAGEDQQVLTVDGDLRAAVLAVDDGVADLDVGRDELTALLRPPARTDRQDLTELRLLLGRVGGAHGHAGQDDPQPVPLALGCRPLPQEGVGGHAPAQTERLGPAPLGGGHRLGDEDVDDGDLEGGGHVGRAHVGVLAHVVD